MLGAFKGSASRSDDWCFLQHPDIKLLQKKLIFGRNPGANVVFKDAVLASEICSLKVRALVRALVLK